jgi:hypothetical protein
MKRNFYRTTFILACCFASLFVRSQVLISLLFGDKLNSDKLIFGIHADYSWNKITNIEPQDALGKLNLSLFFNVRINDHWRAQIEALAKHTRGGKGMSIYPITDPALYDQFANAEGTVERKISYVGLMTAIEYVIDNTWYLEAGPQLTIRTKAKDIFSAKTHDGELELTRDIRDEIARWEFSLLTGFGYKFGKGSGMAIGLRYNWGISDVQINTEGSQQNRGFYIVSNIPIGRNKAKAKSQNTNPK